MVAFCHFLSFEHKKMTATTTRSSIKGTMAKTIFFLSVLLVLSVANAKKTEFIDVYSPNAAMTAEEPLQMIVSSSSSASSGNHNNNHKNKKNVEIDVGVSSNSNIGDSSSTASQTTSDVSICTAEDTCGSNVACVSVNSRPYCQCGDGKFQEKGTGCSSESMTTPATATVTGVAARAHSHKNDDASGSGSAATRTSIKAAATTSTSANNNGKHKHKNAHPSSKSSTPASYIHTAADSPNSDNLCTEVSSTPGCVDPFCMERVCVRLEQSQCCDDAWDFQCAALADSICTPGVVPKPSGPCPAGFVCNEEGTLMSNCSDIRAMPVELKLGDAFAGVLCMEGRNNMVNCPIGHFCPTPFEKLPCPEGWFCPHKSAKPWIECPQCEEGSEELVRQTYGYIIFGIGLFVLILAVAVTCFRRYQKDLWDQQAELLARKTDMIRVAKRRREKEEQLERLKPKLDIISKRLEKIKSSDDDESESGMDSSARMIQLEQDRKLEFHGRKIFDRLDTNKDGSLSYDELNAVLAMNDVELKNFVSRMQELGGKKPTDEASDEVTRSVFIKYFLQVLEENSNLNLTREEAEVICDQILLENCSPVLKEKMLYTSSVSRVLTDGQIYTLIKKFREVQENTGGIAKNKRGSTAADATIPRSVFIELYPSFLLQVITSDDGAEGGGTSQVSGSPGVDICFKDLSLSVKGLDRTINVVDHVTGRIQAKTMTALMGGSGAGKTSLLNALCGRAFYGETEGDIHINGQRKSIDDIKDSVGFVPQDDIVHAELTVRENFIYAGKFRLPRGTSHKKIVELAEETLASLGLSRVADNLVGDVRRRGVSGGEKKRVNIGLELMAKPSCLFLDEPTSGLDASSALLVMSSLRHLVEVQGVTVVSVIHQPRKFIFDLFDSLILLGVGGRMVYHGPTDKALDYFNRLNYVLPAGESVSDWLIDISSGRLEPEPTGPDSEEQDDKNKSTVKSKDGTVVGRKGVSAGKEKDAFEEAKSRRAWLYDKWNEHFKSLKGKDKEMYDVPQKTDLPEVPIKQTFSSQLFAQISREFLISWRNFSGILIDTLILVGATILITVTDGLPEMTRARDPKIDFEDLVNPTEESAIETFKQLFIYAAVPQWQFPLKIGIIVAVLIGLQATRIVTAKKLEFFREASSGYDINAYFVSVHLVSTITHSLQIVILSFFAAWLRDPIASWWSFFFHFLAMIWLCVSWALFFPMVVPADNVTVTVGFFMSFCGLMISGAFPPLTWKVIYDEGGFGEHLAGWLSPTRYFFEGLTVGEYRCLPEQSGWTVADESVNFDRTNTLLHNFGVAGHDPNATQQSCGGWYWGLLPSFLVGLTVRYAGWLAMHALNRGQQTKKSLMFEAQRNILFLYLIALLIGILFGLGYLATWSYTRDLEPNFETNNVTEYTELIESAGGEEFIRDMLKSENVTSFFDLNMAPPIGGLNASMGFGG